ncbi:MAG: hypothetical protein OXU54_08185, partial [Gammaproteobacteria bacterium]|nr:hypothetical protein [Gammaproteobacteria bacterium]
MCAFRALFVLDSCFRRNGGVCHASEKFFRAALDFRGFATARFRGNGEEKMRTGICFNQSVLDQFSQCSRALNK